MALSIQPPSPLLERPLRAAVGSALLFLYLAAAPAWARTAGASPPGDERNLADLSLEELMNETVTSVSKREQRLVDAAAAVFVLSHDDLRRSGATSIAEALRLVPGLDVASVNSGQWAISARGFNSLFANKLLVLVDGRAVYSPLFSGVEWDLQRTTLDEVDRIEVIRGPGATIWGANAVNGVINVVTSRAEETQGGKVYGAGGNVHQAMTGARYGGRIGEKTYFRVVGSHESAADHVQADGGPARDGWQTQYGGVRLDRDSQAGTHLTWQADGTWLNLDHHDSDGYNFNTLGRWTRETSSRSSFEAQAYYDRTYGDDDTGTRNTTDTLDLTAQQTFGLGRHNDVIWGLGCRLIESTSEATNPVLAVRQGDHRLRLFSAFLQDEARVSNRLTLTAGVKLENNDFTGLELQPSARAVFKPAESQTLWAAVSRAVRTPDIVEGRDRFAIAVGAPFRGPGGGLYTPRIVGNDDLAAEVLWAYELGYRVQPAKSVSLDLASFYNDYSHLITIGAIRRFVPGSPIGTAEIPFSNLLSGTTYGGEASVTYSPAATWRLATSYTYLRHRIRGPAVASRGLSMAPPENQLSLRSSQELSLRTSLDAQLRYVDSLPSAPRYFTADLRLAYRATDRLELSLVGQNLLEGQHVEQPPARFADTVGVPRGFYVKVVQRF